MRLLANVFVIVEDTFQMRYSLRHCAIRETEHYSYFDCHNEPTFVLSRVCTNEYYGGNGPCCKVDDAMNFLMNDRPDLFANIKWIMHGDDDTYWRVDQLMLWLASIDNAGMSDFPIIANTNFESQEHVWHIKNCKEILTNGWYQPLVMNKAALVRMKAASAAYGLRDTCNNFKVTHDVGMGVYAWLFGLYHMKIPHITVLFHGAKKNLPPDMMIVHALKHTNEDYCNDAAKWPEKYRYNQKVVLGCGDAEVPSPFHTEIQQADMYDGWNFYRDSGVAVQYQQEFGRRIWDTLDVAVKPAEANSNITQVFKVLDLKVDALAADGTYQGYKVEKRYVPLLNQLYGYNTTKHSADNNILEKWQQFTLQDCKEPGSIGFDKR